MVWLHLCGMHRSLLELLWAGPPSAWPATVVGAAELMGWAGWCVCPPRPVEQVLVPVGKKELPGLSPVGTCRAELKQRQESWEGFPLPTWQQRLTPLLGSVGRQLVTGAGRHLGLCCWSCCVWGCPLTWPEAMSGAAGGQDPVPTGRKELPGLGPTGLSPAGPKWN